MVGSAFVTSGALELRRLYTGFCVQRPGFSAEVVTCNFVENKRNTEQTSLGNTVFPGQSSFHLSLISYIVAMRYAAGCMPASYVITSHLVYVWTQ